VEKSYSKPIVQEKNITSIIISNSNTTNDSRKLVSSISNPLFESNKPVTF